VQIVKLTDAQALLFWQQYDYWLNVEGATGEPMRFENFTQREVQPILEKAGVPWHGLHAFRRFLGITLNEKGIDLEAIKDVLRHSNNNVTKKSCIKPSTKRVREMLEMVEKDFNRALKTVKKKTATV